MDFKKSQSRIQVYNIQVLHIECAYGLSQFFFVAVF